LKKPLGESRGKRIYMSCFSLRISFGKHVPLDRRWGLAESTLQIPEAVYRTTLVYKSKGGEAFS